MIQRSRALRPTPESFQQVFTVANLQYTCSTSRIGSLHLASNKYIENTGTVQNLLNFPCLILCYPFHNHFDTTQMEHTHRSMSSVHRMEMAASVLYEMTALGIRCDFDTLRLSVDIPHACCGDIAGAKAAYDQICQQSFDTEETTTSGIHVQGASPSLAKRR
ncbi:hypothetical protein BASA83_008358 [Batrachochytrium salamandrivorans]|nr:hypothetical protein BASA83_008358 [Batrachochytrium salamandrivorans]